LGLIFILLNASRRILLSVEFTSYR